MAETTYVTPATDSSVRDYSQLYNLRRLDSECRLYRAAQEGDWVTTSKILEDFPSLRLVDPLNADGENVLHVAISSGTAINYVQKLVMDMQPEDLTWKDVYGHTPLISAIIIGNTDAAKLLVHKNPDLLYLSDDDRLLPVHLAAQYGKKDILLFLLKATHPGDREPFPYEAELGAKLLRYTMEAKFYDVCTSLITSFPGLIDYIYTDEQERTRTPLTMLATNANAFRFKGALWRRLYKLLLDAFLAWMTSDEHYDIGSTGRGVVIPLEQTQSPWRAVRFLTSVINHIRPTKSRRYQAIRLVKCLCSHASAISPLKYGMFKEAFLRAAENGIVEIVETLAEAFPDILWEKNADGRNILQIAVLNRRRRVYKLACCRAKNRFYKFKVEVPDTNGNNILHLAAKLAPPQHLQMFSNAALKMMVELRTFEDVWMSLPVFQRTAQSAARNNQSKTPKEVFSEEHKELRQKGEEWIKSTANSCLIPATLIATLAFSAAITMPSSTNNKGYKEFDQDFTIFAIFNAFSLFTSVFSLLISFYFLLFTTFKEDDFAVHLPRRALILILTLYASLASIVLAFCVILVLTFGGSKIWMIVVFTLAFCLPVSLSALSRLIVFLLFTIPKLWKQAGIQH